VYTLYSVELNIAGGARPADHGQWPGRLCSGDRLRHPRHDRILIHDAEVIVGDKGDGSPALVGRRIEDEGPGFGDGSRAPGDHALHSIKITNCQGILWLVPDYFGCCLRQPCIWHSHGYHNRRDALIAEGAGNDVRKLLERRSSHTCPVVDEAINKSLDQGLNWRVVIKS
jgi:hypothetical protein